VHVCSFAEALIDADSALELDPAHVKAHYRRGLAGIHLGLDEVALAEAQLCVNALPTNAAFKKLLEDAKKVGGLEAKKMYKKEK
jgi:regulator of sirC expression with transglutaminase-like and TPR domain